MGFFKKAKKSFKKAVKKTGKVLRSKEFKIGVAAVGIAAAPFTGGTSLLAAGAIISATSVIPGGTPSSPKPPSLKPPSQEEIAAQVKKASLRERRLRSRRRGAKASRLTTPLGGQIQLQNVGKPSLLGS